MSRIPFGDDIEAVTQDGGSYLPAPNYEHQDLVEELLINFIGDEKVDAKENFRLSHELILQMNARDDLEGQPFLDTVIRELEFVDDGHRMCCDALVRSVIGYFYHHGQEFFDVDYHRLPRVTDCAESLFGSFWSNKGPHKLGVSYILPEMDRETNYDRFAEHVRSCQIVVEGGVGLVGDSAHRSSFYIRSLPTQLGRAEECTFYMDVPEEFSSFSLVKPNGFFSLAYASGEYVGVGKQFFSRKNRLFIPDGFDGWKQVMPE